MSVTVSAGATAAASTASALASKRSTEAKCNELVSGYEHTTATIEQRQSYADCIDMMHPSQMTGHEVIGLKIIIVCAFVGALVSYWKGRDSSCGFSESAADALFGVVFGAFAPVLVAVIIWARHFLFTA